MTTLNLQCDESGDDASESLAGDVTIVGTVIYIGDYYGWGAGSGERFPSVSGLSGSAIDSAVLTFRARFSDSGSFIGDFYAHAATAPGVFTTTDFNITGEAQRPRTTATCEGDSTDFGSWTSGQDHTIDGVTPTSGTGTIADIIQELADSYDPSTIVLLHIRASGSGHRVALSYNNDSATAPKLAITYTAGAGSTQTATPSPVVIPISIPSLSSVMYPDPVTIPIAIPLPAVTGGTIMYPEPVVIPIAIPVPTLSAGAVTMTPDPVAVPIAIPVPVVSGDGVAEVFTQWGLIERFADPDEQPPGTTFFLEIGMFTSSALVEVKGRVFNITDGVVVSGSEVTTTETSYTVVRSGSFSLSPGLKKYRIEFGGQQGGVFSCHGGDVKPEGS